MRTVEIANCSLLSQASPYTESNMQNLTYRQLLEALNELTPEQLANTVSVFDPSIGEVIPVFETSLVSELQKDERDELEDVIPFDHPVLVLATGNRINAE